MSWLKNALAALLLILLLLAMGGLFLFGTTPGLYRLLDAAHYCLPGFNVKKVTGHWHDFTLHDLHYHVPGIEIHIDKLHLAGGLKHGQLCIENVQLQGVDIVLEQRQKPLQTQQAVSRSWFKLPIPYPGLLLRQVTLSHFNLKMNESRVTLTSLSGGALWKGHQFTLHPTRVDDLSVILPVRPASAPFTVDQVPQRLKQLENQLRTPLLTLAMLKSTAHWPFEITIQALSGNHWRLQDGQEQLIQHVSLTAHSKRSQLAIAQLSIDTPETHLKMSGTITLKKEYPIALQAVATVQSGPLQGERLQAHCKGALLGKLSLSLDMSGLLSLQAKAAVRLSEVGMPFNLSVQSQAVQWPLAMQRIATLPSSLQAQDLTLTMNGQLTAYTLSLTARVQGENLPHTGIRLRGQGNLHRLIVQPLHLSLLDGAAQLTGQLSWNQQWRWQGYLHLTGINTQQQWADWPMTLAGYLKSSAAWAQNQWRISVPALQLQGKIKDKAFDIKGSLQGHSSSEWPIAQLITHLRAVIGPNRFEVAGQWDEQVALSALVKAPQLDLLFPGLSGAIQGQLKLSGTREHPQIVTSLSADNVVWQAFKLARLKFNSRLRRTSQVQGSLSLGIHQLVHNTVKIDHLTVNASGHEKQHQLHLAMQGTPLSGALKVRGQFTAHDGHWQASVSETHLQTFIGEWRPTRTIHIDYRQLHQQLSISAHRWRGPGSLISLPQLSSIQGNGQARVDIERFDLTRLQPLLTHVTQLQGIVTGHSSVRWQRSHHLPEVHLTLNGQSIQVVHLTKPQPVTIQLDKMQFNARLEEQQALFNGMLTISQKGMHKGSVRYTLCIADLQKQRILAGDIHFDQLSLLPLDLILLPNEGAHHTVSEGTLNGHLRFAGSLVQPQLFGQVVLTKAQFKGLLPFDIVNGQVVLACKGQTSHLDGLFKTAQGALRLQGDAQWRDWTAWHSTLTLKGDRLAVTASPTMQLEVIPDLQVKATPQLISLKGQLTIPSARINIDILPVSAIKVSKSEVIVNHQWLPVTAKQAMIPLYCDVAVMAGDDVLLNAFGLQSKIDGRLKIVQAKQELGVYGQLNLHQGRFRAYGQDLRVRKGKVLFSGPVNQGLLDIEAIRDPEKTEQNVVVGLRISGLIDAPEVVVFSEPLLPESEALTYLLHGRKRMAGSDLAIASQISLSLLQSGKGVKTKGLTGVVGQVGQMFGIRDLSIDTALIEDYSQIVISGYVWRDLQFKYGVALSTLTLRFRLMPHLYLDVVSGIERALNLLYQFEF